MRLSKTIQAAASTASQIIGAALFGSLFCVFIIQIIARFFFNQPMAWTDELAVVLYIWMVLWCAAFVCRDREHVMFDLAYNVVSPSTQRLFQWVGALALVVIVGYSFMGNWDYVWFMRREKTPVLGIPFFLGLHALYFVVIELGCAQYMAPVGFVANAGASAR